MSRLRRLEARAAEPGGEELAVPELGNIMDFLVKGCEAKPYPRQATILKVVAGAAELFTEHDHAALEEWTSRYHDVENGYFVGETGMTPDIHARMQHISDAQRWSFRQAVFVGGRRCGKTNMAAALLVWLVWRLICLGDPHSYFGIPRRKRISILLLSTSLATTLRDCFGDVRILVEGCEWLRPYVVSIDEGRIVFRTPYELAFPSASRRGSASIVIEAAATTSTVARGLSLIGASIDEAAYMEGAGSTSSASQILAALTPAMAQFERESLLVVSSSPASQIGGFFDIYRRACAVDERTAGPRTPDVMMAHLMSWDPYLGWESAHGEQLYPGGPFYPRFRRAIVTRDSPEIEDARQTDELLYQREYESRWSSGQHPFLPTGIVERVFSPFKGTPLMMQQSGDAHRWRYYMHVDPSATRDNTAVVVGHAEEFDGAMHFVADFVQTFSPGDFEGGEISYRTLATMIVEIAERFDFPPISLDTYQGHALKAMLEERVEALRRRATITVESTNQSSKRDRWLLFRDLAAEGLIHCPDHRLLRRELVSLQDDGSRIQAPTSGLTRTDDTADALSWAVLMAQRGGEVWMRRLSESRLVASRLQVRAGPFGRMEYSDAFSAVGGWRRRQSAPSNPARGINRPGRTNRF